MSDRRRTEAELRLRSRLGRLPTPRDRVHAINDLDIVLSGEAVSLVYLPIDCPVCGRRRVEWNGEVLRCEKCSTSSEWDGFTKDRYETVAMIRDPLLYK